MDTVELIQGTPEWHQHRANHDNASDAPAMLGESPYQTRSALLKAMATGLKPEIDAGTQRRFDDGHRFEALARPLAEEIIGDELFPITGTVGRLSASFDGLTMDESVAFEHKTLNDTLRACKTAADLPPAYRIQMCQQAMVSGAKKILFMASKWNPDDTLIEEKHFWYKPEQALCERIQKGWAQFHEDLINYQHVEEKPVVIAAPIEDLPALVVEMVGQVTSSNLATFQTVVLERIKAINTDIKTDADFADAEKMVKFLDDGEKRLEMVKAQALSQTASIDELFRTIASLQGEMKAKRLTLDKLVKARKDSIRVEIQQAAQEALAQHIQGLNKRLGSAFMPAIAADFAGAMKGKRSIASLHDAVDTEISRAKIEANAVADRIDANKRQLIETDSMSLFPDFAQVCTKSQEDFDNLLSVRVDQRKVAEEKRIEAEATRIRAETQAKAASEIAEAKRAEVASAQEAANERRAAEALHQQKVQAGIRYDALKVHADKKPRIVAKLNVDRADLAAWEAKVAKVRGMHNPSPLSCPHCAGLLSSVHGVLVAYKEPEYDAEMVGKLPEYEAALTLSRSAVANGERDLRAAEDSELQMKTIENTYNFKEAA